MDIDYDTNVSRGGIEAKWFVTSLSNFERGYVKLGVFNNFITPSKSINIESYPINLAKFEIAGLIVLVDNN